MKKKLYVLNQRQEETYDAAGKAMRDVFCVLAECGSKVIWSVPKRCNKILKAIDLPYLACYLLFCVGKKSAVLYSIPENHMKIRMLKMMQKVKKYELVCFINDLNAFRYGSVKISDMDEQAREELSVVCLADTILIPNKGTEKMFQKLDVSARLVPVGVWDYLMSREQSLVLEEISSKTKKVEKKTQIAFAGNLNKSGFLPVMDIPEGIVMELWGKLDPDKKEAIQLAQGEKCRYHGVLSSDEIPSAICTMDYGLVWDGVGKDEISGGLGEYLRYNNSHKCALYLASGIPVIVWEESGMAHFVKEHACGITIRCLSELEEKIRMADYEKLKEQAKKISGRLQQGYYLKQAIGNVIGE